MRYVLAGLVVVLVIVFVVMIVAPRKTGSQKIAEAFSGVKIDRRAVADAVAEGEKLKRQMQEEQKRIDEAKGQLSDNMDAFEDEALGW